MPVERDRYRTASAIFAVSYMSNAKWVRAFTVIARLGPFDTEWKLIHEEAIHRWGSPWESELHPIGLLGGGGFDALEYKWIEWVRFPRLWRHYPHFGRITEQNLDGIVAALGAVGQFQIERNDEYLYLYGYGRLPPAP